MSSHNSLHITSFSYLSLLLMSPPLRSMASLTVCTCGFLTALLNQPQPPVSNSSCPFEITLLQRPESLARLWSRTHPEESCNRRASVSCATCMMVPRAKVSHIRRWCNKTEHSSLIFSLNQCIWQEENLQTLKELHNYPALHETSVSRSFAIKLTSFYLKNSLRFPTSCSW